MSLVRSHPRVFSDIHVNVPIFRNKLLSHAVRFSRGLQPLYIYNTRIIWKRAMLVRTGSDSDVKSKRKKRKWLPPEIYRGYILRNKYYSVMDYNTEQYYITKSFQHKYRLRIWRWPYLFKKRIWEKSVQLKELKGWLLAYRLPMMFRNFYRGYRLSMHMYRSKNKFRKLRAFIRENHPRVYNKYLATTTELKKQVESNKLTISKPNAKNKNLRNSCIAKNRVVKHINKNSKYSSYDRLSLLMLLIKVLSQAIVYNKNKLQISSLCNKLRTQLFNLRIKSLRMLSSDRLSFICKSTSIVRVLKALAEHLLYPLSVDLCTQLFTRYISTRSIYLRKYAAHNRSSVSLYSNSSHKSRKEVMSKLRSVSKIQKKHNVARRFRLYTDIRSRMLLDISSRCSLLKLRDASIPLTLRKPTFFSDLFYYCTKVRTLLNLSMLWCNLQLICSKPKHLLVTRSIRHTLFFFRSVYFSELSRGIREYTKYNFKLLHILDEDRRVPQLHYTLHIQTLYFFVKYIYLDFLHSFISAYAVKRRWLSHTFFLFMLCNVSKKYIAHSLIGLLNKHSTHLTFVNFVNGYVNKRPSRLLFVLNNTANSTFFMFWILRLYICVNHKIRLRGIIKKTFVLLTTKFKYNTRIVDIFVFMLLKIVSFIRYLYSNLYIPSDKYYIITSFIWHSKIDTFRISNVATNMFLIILRIGTDVYQLREILFRYSVRLFTHSIEYTLFSFTKVQYFFFARYYYNTIPPLNNARMLCNYIIIKIASGSKIKEAFDGVYTWQNYWKNKLDREYLKYRNVGSGGVGVDIREFVYPVKGIRIICSGPSYKARRTTAVKYLVWVSDEYLTGKMPLSTININIEYVQSHVVLRRSIIGIKVWLLLEEEVTFA